MKWCRIVVLVSVLCLGPSAAMAEYVSVFQSQFGDDESELGGNGTWSNGYCDDPWLADDGRAHPLTDSTCSTGGFGGCNCAWGSLEGCFPGSGSEVVDNHLTAGDVEWSDYRLDVDMRNSDDDAMGVVFRYQDSGSYYLLFFTKDSIPSVNGGCNEDAAQASYHLYRVQSGLGSLLSEQAVELATGPVTYAYGETYHVRVDVTGDQIRAWLVKPSAVAGLDDGGTPPLFTVFDSAWSQGRIGLYAYNNGKSGSACDDDGCWFQNVQVHEWVEPVVLDSDGDGVIDGEDNCPELPNQDQGDFDSDDIGDACDDDVDGDGIPNAADNCPFVTSGDVVDTDGDGAGNPCDDDDDGDGYLDGQDNCPLKANQDQADLDGDGMGDLCDKDLDGDGVDNGVDNCVQTPNFQQYDGDSDGIGDVCDTDYDQDGIPNDEDDCPLNHDPDQLDTDGDGNGDACDTDDDGDGVLDADDNCPGTINPDQFDTDGDGVGDACTSCASGNADGDDVCNAEDNCPSVSNQGQEDLDGDGFGNACDEDSDNDGIADADEAELGTDAFNPDTDGDGVVDGVEIGNTTGTQGTDPGVFGGDADPASTTDPLNPDTDGDGLLDGEEDANGNGKIDAGESDPNDANDPISGTGEEVGEEPGEEVGEEPGEEVGEGPGEEDGEEPGEEVGEGPGEEVGEGPGRRSRRGRGRRSR